MKFTSVVATAAVMALGAASNVTVIRSDEPFVPNNKLPPSHASSDGADIVRLFANLGRSTAWKLVSKTHLEGDTGEPEGMALVGNDRLFVSAGQWTVPTQKYPHPINGTDRTAGAGFAHMLIYDREGRLIANATLTPPGDIEYHPGGIEYDGRYVWGTLAQYRPNATATVVQIDPLTLDTKSLFRTRDHNGGIVHDTITDDIVTLNWGGRNATTWSLKNYPRGFTPLPGFTAPISSAPSPSFFVDYQDCKFLGHHDLPAIMAARLGFSGGQASARALMFCGGVATIRSSFNLGGIALVDLQTMLPVWEVPIALTSDLGAPLTQNPIDIAVVDDKLRIYCLPDQHNSTLYVYEAS
ncbi:uncharacterized protein N7459_008174 [Penicillium hispanicum]|uniref:uncharacterized protein n=1 Tax=Penicillium hispanicum TaxID=1080232 RepID=UPI00253F7E0C|nr:uncharacterized protein N7459_008174 [Penicillium hispanicum]KAJ5573747.1 hypothetical protein N7459_008174 [Penicillium hispanicum]